MARSEQEITYKELAPGNIVTEPGSASQYRTGDWRSQRPVIDRELCSKCALCFLYCPEGCVREIEEGFFEPDLFYCKGCGICAEECPRKAIKMEEEKEK